MTGRVHQGGFTLVELLIALALTGLVSLLILGGTRFAALGLDRVSDQAARLEARRSIDALLRRALSSAAAAPLRPNEAALAGGPQSLSFLSLADDGGAGLYRVDLDLEAAGLVLRRQRIGAVGNGARIVLTQSLRTFKIEYYGAPPGAGDPGWHESWERSRIPPRLVRITLDTGDGIARPPLVVRLWTAPE
jgi:general secretion pathway protein J